MKKLQKLMSRPIGGSLALEAENLRTWKTWKIWHLLKIESYSTSKNARQKNAKIRDVKTLKPFPYQNAMQ